MLWFFKIIDEKIAESEFIVWLMINVTEVSRIIAAWIIDVKFEYILLLECHWMQSVHLINDYNEKMYMIQNDKDEWYNLSCLIISTSAETEFICRWVAIKLIQIVKIEKDESENKTDEKISDKKAD